jgi:hypothetical protein
MASFLRIVLHVDVASACHDGEGAENQQNVLGHQIVCENTNCEGHENLSEVVNQNVDESSFGLDVVAGPEFSIDCLKSTLLDISPITAEE